MLLLPVPAQAAKIRAQQAASQPVRCVVWMKFDVFMGAKDSKSAAGQTVFRAYSLFALLYFLLY